MSEIVGLSGGAHHHIIFFFFLISFIVMLWRARHGPCTLRRSPVTNQYLRATPDQKVNNHDMKGRCGPRYTLVSEITYPLTNEPVPILPAPRLRPPYDPHPRQLAAEPRSTHGDSSCQCMYFGKMGPEPDVNQAKARRFRKRTRSELGGWV